MSGHVLCSFSIPSARYTDKADGSKRCGQQENGGLEHRKARQGQTGLGGLGRSITARGH
ncbi:hypothetical protein D554_0930 [Bordetella holmesii 30539]|uniref:N-acetyltransferase YedL n=1 Tax=Bordetella holmesii 1058 TaxID=1247648 RepID=A0ABP3BPP2_9BORD|nr:hypothetical protein D560_1454 [Bordetella holmesii ATCC 51541]AIT26119.1 hypothetical protein D558_1445 [Bordetella holmesii 44057]EWM44350.1 hypothetical protein D556_1457 [Bordetella holmesii 41130]EWM46691.1 hypothetical protein D555_1470 [Bordetella holmesii 35009]EWM50856.1 hypothetical protein D557_0705 [Bordetella holmesii 70147]EXF89726.1 hypothetical protein D554_0930 [Bordetella holmesii 30539]EXX95935.1 hypothetical protein D559_3377 [Bordetella holmesii 1058]